MKIIKNIKNIKNIKSMKIIISVIIILFLLYVFFVNFFGKIEGFSEEDIGKINKNSNDINTVKAKQANLMSEMSAINDEIKTSNIIMIKEKKKIENTIKKAEVKATESGVTP